ncbi:MAG: hypothetical protein A2V90_08355 [Gammaproteobacteria bacterium RBG_16_57_12]|nr:MAG: hypothetical protein A2V90_08355 [Gammaproteobacteria bacterium RBG_16_57_12]
MDFMARHRQPLKLDKLWRLIGRLLVIAIIIVSLIPNPQGITPAFANSDKVGHLLAYTILMSWHALIYQRKEHVKLLLLFIMLGAALELVQSITDYRSFELLDMLANAGGVVAGWALGGTVYIRSLISFESWLVEKKVLKHG